VNPAEAATRGQAVNDYLWQVARKFSQYRYYSNDREEGTVVARLTIARDGRLLGVSVAQSSGFATLDKGVVETIQAAAPYAPLTQLKSPERAARTAAGMTAIWA
jgi:protein TonB